MTPETHNARPENSADALIARAARLSHYARRLIEAMPPSELDVNVARAFTRDEMRSALEADPGDTEDDLKRTLRVLRARVMLRLMARDFGGLAPLDEVLATSTALAEVAVGHALDRLDRWLASRHGRPIGEESGREQRLHVIGMGKLGGAELNVSSDIDLIFVYPEEGATRGPRPISNHEYFTRLGRSLIAALSEITADGYVLRVDMRLRPYGNGGPLVASFDALEDYLITQGREWERFAWIKARPLTGDRGGELMEIARPFVYRRHLDYNALASLRDLHRQIRHEVERRDLCDDIKLGPGGIREIEFIAQVFQLIRGGRDPELRKQPTLAVLPLLAIRNLLPVAAAEELTEAYRFLRNLEHRLQYRDDQQTHALPDPEAERALIAETMGFTGYEALYGALQRHRGRVTLHFEAIFATSPTGEHALTYMWEEPDEGERILSELAALGFRQPQAIRERLRNLRVGGRYRAMPAESQARLDRLVPLAIESAAAEPEPDATLARVLDLLDSISRRGSYLALLEEYPQALARLASMMSASSWVAQYLTRHPILLDELLDTRTLYAAPDWAAAAAQLRAQLDDAKNDAEKQMDLLRQFKHAYTVRFVAQDLAGLLPVESLADRLSELADLILEETTRLCWQSLGKRYRERPAFAIIGYGKLGGKELGYASDLDLIFLYEDGTMEAPEAYARLAQRINHWLTSLTPAGVLYETDLRLRPDGAGGMLVSPIEAFEDYQLRHAWAWEHQALTRGRFCAGDAQIGAKFEDVRRAVLQQARNLSELRREVAAMRRKMHDGHPNRSGLFDLKHDAGGIVDVEFIVQYLVLGYAHRHTELTRNVGNLALLKLAGGLGLIPAALAEAVRIAYREFRRRQHLLRLAGEKYARVEPAAIHAHAESVQALWRLLFDAPDA